MSARVLPLAVRSAPQRALRDLAATELGTVGAGNHHVDLFAGDDDHLPVGCHLGLRGFGHRTASGSLALHAGTDFHEHAPEGEMDSPLILLPTDSERGQASIAALPVAGEDASADAGHNHHDVAWRERPSTVHGAGRATSCTQAAGMRRADMGLGARADAVQILHRLDPMGVAMAALDTFDPYKD